MQGGAYVKIYCQLSHNMAYSGVFTELYGIGILSDMSFLRIKRRNLS
jgi:hypothetical protein